MHISTLPIGYDDYGSILDQKLTIVDKSLFIKDVIEDQAQVLLITRPRRFGKTLNLSLLRYFFAESVIGRPTRGLFDHLKISQYPPCMAHQGKYPVISLTFKDLKKPDYPTAYLAIGYMLAELYAEHANVLCTSEKITRVEQQKIQSIIERNADPITLQMALKDLTAYLYRLTGVKPIILIDEYDTPIQAAYINDYYAEMMCFMREFLGAGLKNNLSLHKAVLSGILQVAKESLFSGLNNLKVYSLLHPAYSQYFGFTEPEVHALFQAAQLSEEEYHQVQDWYNGYQVGGTRIYNPWSIANYLNDIISFKRNFSSSQGISPEFMDYVNRTFFKLYWVNTSDNVLIKELLLKSKLSIKEKLTGLLQNQPLEVIIDEEFVYPDLGRGETAFWSLFLMSGYLKATGSKIVNGRLMQTIAIPNQEVRSLYRSIIEDWLVNDEDIHWYDDFLMHLLTGNVVLFEEALRQIILQIASYHDLARSPEAFYHGLLLGLSASLNANEYLLYSNRESGLGRYDLAIIPHDPERLGILIELKAIKLPKALSKQVALLQKEATRALAQMEAHQYMTEFRQHGIHRVCQMGIAFCGKTLKIAHVIRDT